MFVGKLFCFLQKKILIYFLNKICTSGKPLGTYLVSYIFYLNFDFYGCCFRLHCWSWISFFYIFCFLLLRRRSFTFPVLNFNRFCVVIVWKARKGLTAIFNDLLVVLKFKILLRLHLTHATKAAAEAAATSTAAMKHHSSSCGFNRAFCPLATTPVVIRTASMNCGLCGAIWNAHVWLFHSILQRQQM